MKCIACDRDFTGSSCPHCGFPVYELVGDDLDASTAQILELAKNHRKEYLKDIEVGVVAYSWKDENGLIVEDQHFTRYFASGEALSQGEVWLPDPLARIPDETVIPIQVAIKKGGTERLVNVSLPNLLEAELQQVGVQLVDGLKIKLLLRNPINKKESDEISLTAG